MMRKHALIAGVAVVAVAAVGLRVRSQWGRKQVSILPPPASRPAAGIPVPRDYVVDPAVVPEEAAAGPKRIISLAPSVTEIVCALGMRDRLVGRTRHCHWPPGLEPVQTVGVVDESNYGLIKSLQPDLILLTRNSGAMLADLTKLGLRCEAVPHEGLDEVYAAIEKIGGVCGRPQTAAALVAAMRTDIERLRGSAAKLGVPPKRVVVLFGALPVPPQAVFVAGPGLFLSRLVELAGHRNAARDLLKSSQGEIPLERMRVLDPDMILEFRGPSDEETMADVYQAWSQVGDLRAIRNQKVRSIGGGEWLSAGPRIAVELHRFISVLSEPE
ncbi:MAG: ABC transporter substrate-binding protein [Planctomycetes bacterium]|nr:ABC transporter substrate-binding protein [Planctomycetota bacterium]